MIDSESVLDFVIPVCRNNIIIRVTIESIIKNYNPKNIYVITNKTDLEILEIECLQWNVFNTKLIFIDEEMYFITNYGLTKTDIYQWYTWKDEQSREYGWWYQQLIKLGAYKQIPKLSDPYVVWDSDLIVIQKWDLYDKNSNTYKFAILQECAKNEFNKNEYANSINELIGLHAIEPPIGGTFVPHHFIMYHKVLEHLKSKGNKIALASSSSMELIETVVKKLNLSAYFDQLHSAEKEKFGKPHPGIFITAAESMNAKAHECMVFEDSKNGVIAAKAARMACIAVPETLHYNENWWSIADAKISSLDEYLAIEMNILL
jgi:FMN phosphatase YigB (HAD superfamily)